ncbi:MAG: hypothetical protein K2X39_05630 [Silvanigrellaceae bacterium]|nr:hypothetical protein [Silvanigrellaceae bacterium]
MNFFLKIILVLLFAFLASSCQLRQKGTIKIKVMSNNTPLSRITVTLNEHEERLTNEQGEAVWEVYFQQLKQAKIVAKSDNIEDIYLPGFLFVEHLPQWWEEQILNYEIKLNKIENYQIISDNKTSTKETINSKNKEKYELKLDVLTNYNKQFISFLEKDIIENEEKNSDLNNEYKIHPPEKEDLFANKIEIKELKNENVNPIAKKSLPQSQEKPFSYYENSFTIKVQSEKKDLSNTLIYGAKSGAKTLTLLGETNNNGEFKIEKNKDLMGDMIIAMHKCCKSIVYPFSIGSGKETLKIELMPTKEQLVDLFIQSYAFGVAKGIEKVELRTADKLINISSSIGFIPSIPADTLSESFLTSLNTTQPKTLFPPYILPIEGNKQPVTLFLSLKNPLKPNIALFETIDLNDLPIQSPFRKARREFFSRFIGNSEFSPMIQAQLLQLSQAAQLPVDKMLTQGWDSSELSKDIDFIFSFELINNNNNLNVKLIEKTGKIHYQNEFTIAQHAVELQGAEIFEALLDNIPFEGSPLKLLENGIVTNLAEQHNLSEGDYVLIYGSQDALHPPIHPIAVGKVNKINNKQSEIKYLFKASTYLEKKENLRIAKVPKSLINHKNLEKISFNSLAHFL